MRCLKVGKKYFPSFNLFRQISNNCVSSLKIESFLPLSRPPTLVLTLKIQRFSANSKHLFTFHEKSV